MIPRPYFAWNRPVAGQGRCGGSFAGFLPDGGLLVARSHGGQD